MRKLACSIGTVLACVGPMPAMAQNLPAAASVLEQVVTMRGALLADTTPVNVCAIDSFFEPNGELIRNSLLSRQILFHSRMECFRNEKGKRPYLTVILRRVVIGRDSVVVEGETKRGPSTVYDAFTFTTLPGGSIRFHEYRITGIIQP